MLLENTNHNIFTKLRFFLKFEQISLFLSTPILLHNDHFINYIKITYKCTCTNRFKIRSLHYNVCFLLFAYSCEHS